MVLHTVPVFVQCRSWSSRQFFKNSTFGLQYVQTIQYVRVRTVLELIWLLTLFITFYLLYFLLSIYDWLVLHTINSYDRDFRRGIRTVRILTESYKQQVNVLKRYNIHNEENRSSFKLNFQRKFFLFHYNDINRL